MIKNFLNPKGHQNRISGSKVTVILLKGWILPTGGASAGEGLPCSLCSGLVLSEKCLEILFLNQENLGQSPNSIAWVNFLFHRMDRFVTLDKTTWISLWLHRHKYIPSIGV